MYSRSISQRIFRRCLLVGGVFGGVILQQSVSCGDQVKTLVLTGAEELIVGMVRLFFDIITPGVTGTGTTPIASIQSLTGLLG